METKQNVKQVYNRIMNLANTDRWHNNSTYDLNVEELSSILRDIKALDCFAAKVAATIDEKITGHSKKVAYISEKQAWVLAFAIVENDIELPSYDYEDEEDNEDEE